MKTLLLDEIRVRMGAKGHAEMVPAHVTGVSTDSRRIKEGDLFFALRGPNFDGHAFAAEVLAKGATAIVAEKGAELAAGVDIKRVLLVEDTVTALGKLAGYYRGTLSGTVIAVTGSNGKTTTKELIYHILSKRYRGGRSVKSFNNHIGVPLTLLSCEADDEFLVAEVGTNHPGEIDQLGGIVRPDVAVIVNAGESHLEGFGSVDRVAAEKASLAKHVKSGGAVVVNGDRELLSKLVGESSAPAIRFGFSEANDMRITSLESDAAGVRFEVNGKFWFELPVLGRHNALNGLAAIVVARRMGFEMEEIGEAMKDFTLPGMRLELTKVGDVTILNDAYNANPASMGAALEVLRDYPAMGRRVFCCGQMFELGQRTREYHLELARKIGEAGVDVMVAVGEYAEAMVKEAKSAGMKAKQTYAFSTSEAAGEAIGKIVRGGDLVLVKGSRMTAMEKIIEKVLSAKC
jgi:UDP-N-acetylmuramoyl-tripeptide--D-alanyl-D-alanine ligase